MDEPTELLARTIGARVKNERQARKWTLDQLATHAGVSRRMVVNVEQGIANPSVGTLLRLSDALGVSLPALVEPSIPKQVKVTRTGDGATLWTGENGGRGILVASAISPKALELWEWMLMPGEQHSSEGHSAGTQELLQVLEGEVTIQVASDTFTLAQGDAMSFPGDEPHAYINPAQQPARFTMTVLEPGVGTSPRAENSHV
jgi:transcriptional regulator with XRE-family HTH domain